MDQEVASSFQGGSRLPLVESFYTVQGEGFHTGKAAYFIRLGGCDVGCSWCDTKFSWNPRLHPVVPAEEIVAGALNSPAAAVVVTGGEPLMVNLDYLTRLLKAERIDTFLETSGSCPLTGEWDWICLSPKREAPPVGDIHRHANELKMIISQEEDIAWAVENSRKVRKECKLYLQPEWSNRGSMIPVIVDYVKKHPRWMVSLQVHKYMRIP